MNESHHDHELDLALEQIASENRSSTSNINNKNKLSEIDLNIQGLEYCEVSGDGSGLYNAVAPYLAKDPQQLRNEVADFLNDHIDDDIVNPLNALLLEGQTLRDYIFAIGNGGAWADEIEITALTLMYNRPIAVITAGGKISNMPAISPFLECEPILVQEPIFVFYNGHDHYDALLVSDRNVKDLLEELVLQSAPSCAQPHT